MLKDGAFVQNKTTEINIKKLSQTQYSECEKRICELAELAADSAAAASELYSDGYGIYEILGVLLDGIYISKEAPGSDVPQESRERLESYLSAIEANDKAAFSELFVSLLKKTGIDLTEEDFLPTERGDETFVYVKNRLADEAYDVFSQEFSSARVAYAQSFKEAARAVAHGKAEYCLLPLEEHGGARLPSIAALLFSEDLKIDSVTPVFGFDGAADMKYALASRHFTVPKVAADADRYLELRFEADTPELVTELFTVAKHLGISLYRVNTINFDTEDGETPFFSIVLRKNGADFVSLLVYLTLFCPSYTAVGIYDNLE